MNRAFMSDSGFELRHEIQELKAEVRRLRRMIEGGCVVVGLAIKDLPGTFATARDCGTGQHNVFGSGLLAR